MAASEGYVGPFGGYVRQIVTVLGSLGLRCWFLKAMLENLEAMLGHLEAMLGHVEGLGSASCGSVVGFWKLCRAIWRPCWDYVRQLVARVIVFGSYVVPLCWNSVG